MFVLFLFLAIVGYYSWTRLAIDAYPDIADTTVQVVTQVPGLAAEEIEQQISIPIERAMNGLPLTFSSFPPSGGASFDAVHFTCRTCGKVA